MPGWMPGYFLANVFVAQPIEHSYYALVSAEDDRVIELRRKHRELNTFIQGFTDNFKHPIVPSLIILRDDTPADLITIDAVAGFRDAIALAFVCKARTMRMLYPHSRALQYSSWFDFYPWVTDKNYRGIIGNSPAFTDINRAEEFGGQSDASIPYTHAHISDADSVLLAALLGNWERRFITHPDKWRETALFRSLNMAYAASQIPSGPDMTHYALGRGVGLWISAFEILAHPGPNGDVGYRDIYRLLHEAEWREPGMLSPIHDAYAGRNKVAKNILPCWLYGELFHARNDFLHGKPVALDRLVLSRSKRTLYNYAAPLYRMCLTAFLGLNAYGPDPQGMERLIPFVSWRRSLERGQSYIEAAISTVLKPL